MLAFLADEAFGGAAWALREAGTVGWVPLVLLLTGVGNCVTCLPMSKFNTRGRGGGLDPHQVVVRFRQAGGGGRQAGGDGWACWLVTVDGESSSSSSLTD